VILYLDTSCFAKLYIEEAGTDMVRAAVAKAAVIASSLIAEAEMRSALARRKREGVFSPTESNALKKAFSMDWAESLRIPLTEDVSSRAGNLAERHGLRGFDAIHLASALSLREAPGDEEVWFYSADAKLNLAARKEGFTRLFQVA
jgi:predicted nucleic acid-binding protein